MVITRCDNHERHKTHETGKKQLEKLINEQRLPVQPTAQSDRIESFFSSFGLFRGCLELDSAT